MFEDILVHRGKVPERPGEGGTWIEGEWVPNPPVPGPEFDCCLFLPEPGAEDVAPQVPLGRRIVQPTLLYAPYTISGAYVALKAEDELDVRAEEINRVEGRAEDAFVRWQVVGNPQPFGRPGDEPVGLQAALRRVEE